MRRAAALLLLPLLISSCRKGTGPGGALQARIREATVFIESAYRPIGVDGPTATDGLLSWGSGFLIAREGLVITNAHVVESVKAFDRRTGASATEETPAADNAVYVLQSVTVRTHSGTTRSRVYPARVLCTRPMPDDLALLRIRPDEPLTTLSLLSEEESRELDVGVPVQAWGFPLGMAMENVLERSAELAKNPNGPDISMRPGVITSLRKSGERTVKAVEIDCAIEHGNSGGPLVDDRARVVGVVYMGVGETSRFAIPTWVIRSCFGQTLQWRRDEDEGGRRSRARTWRAAADGSGEGLTAALRAARPGDTVELSDGRHEWELGVPFPAGVWVRGQGADRTTITGPVEWLYEKKGMKARVIEMSDLTIEGAADGEVEPFVLGIPEGSYGHEKYLHDVTIRRRHVLFDCNRDETNVVNCTIASGHGNPAGQVEIRSGEVTDPVPRARFERVSFELLEPDSYEARPVVVVRGPVEAVFEGCAFVHRGGGVVQHNCEVVRIEEAKSTYSHHRDPSLRGCRFFHSADVWGSGTLVWVTVDGGGGDLADNLFELRPDGGDVGVLLGSSSSDTKIRTNRFVCIKAQQMAFPVGGPYHAQAFDFRHTYIPGHAIRVGSVMVAFKFNISRNLFFRSAIVSGTQRERYFQVEETLVNASIGNNVYFEAWR